MREKVSEKTRINCCIPKVLHERLKKDSAAYGINQVDIITNALTEYYIRRDSLTTVK